MSAESSPTPIAYAQQASTQRRLIRRLWLPAFVLLFLASAYWWGPPLWWRLRLEYLYSRCLAHSAPTTLVVFQDGDFTTSAANYVPSEWRRFYATVSPPGFQSGGTAYLGSRETPSGREVLVAIEILRHSPWTPASQRTKTFHVRSFARTGRPAAPKLFIDAGESVYIPTGFQLFAGQSDPNDPTHFTIEYRNHSGEIGVIDGWVRENGIDLQSRAKPLPVNPSPPSSPD